MKAFVKRRASVLAVPAIACIGWSGVAFAEEAPAAPVAAPAPPAPPAAPPAPKWYEKAKIEGFVDTYASVNFNFPKPQTPNALRAFDVTNGFAMHWAGLNASYAPDPVGGFVALRFGPGATIYNGPDTAQGLQYVKEAYASWKPGGGKLQLDMGKFSTWIGAEVSDSQYNMTYTRSVLFYTQPVFHTGLRLDYAATDQVDIKLYAVNGAGTGSVDNNLMKSFGATLTLMPTKDMTFYLGYIGGPEQSDIKTTTVNMMDVTVSDKDANSRFKHLIDVVADLHFDKAHVLINADYGTEKVDPDKSSSWYGASGTVGYAVNDQFAVALRGGYTADPDGYVFGTGKKTSVVDAALTLAAMPTPNLIIKLEPRIDSISVDGQDGYFAKGVGDAPSKTQFTTTLGVVATTN